MRVCPGHGANSTDTPCHFLFDFFVGSEKEIIILEMLMVTIIAFRKVPSYLGYLLTQTYQVISIISRVEYCNLTGNWKLPVYIKEIVDNISYLY